MPKAQFPLHDRGANVSTYDLFEVLTEKSIVDLDRVGCSSNFGHDGL